MWYEHFQTREYGSRWVTSVTGQPGWVSRLALTLAAVAVVLPLLALALVGLLVGFVAFVLFALIAQIVAVVQALARRIGYGGTRDGRRNVRPIRRDWN